MTGCAPEGNDAIGVVGRPAVMRKRLFYSVFCSPDDVRSARASRGRTEAPAKHMH
jgi:hypothetical protein